MGVASNLSPGTLFGSGMSTGLTESSGVHKVASTTLTSAAQTITFTGLNLVNDGFYILLLSAKNDGAGQSNLALQYNGDTTGTNYYGQNIVADGGANSSSRDNDDGILTAISVGGSGQVLAFISQVTGEVPRATCFSSSFEPTTVFMPIVAHTWTSTATVTSITISSGVADGLGVGTKAELWGVTA